MRKILGLSRGAELRLSTSKDHRGVSPCEIEDVEVDAEGLKVIWMDYKISVCWENIASN